MRRPSEMYVVVCFFNDTATTEIYTYGHTLSLHDALPISQGRNESTDREPRPLRDTELIATRTTPCSRHGSYAETCPSHPHASHVESIDRKSTRLNSSH